MTRGLKLLTVRGIDVKVDPSWLIIAALITWSFWGRYTEFYGRGGKVALVMAIVGALLFFASVLVHELAHSFEAQHRGVEVGGITLFLFGGATETSFDVKRPVDEFALTALGPFTSFVLAAGFGLVATGADEAGWSAVAQVAGQLGWINLALGVFNLIPGAPLDGGRILRAAVWKFTGDRRRAKRVAANAGRLFGFALVALGVIQLLTVPGAFVGGAWLAFIGWFLSRAASAELLQDELQNLLSDVPARELMSRNEPLAPDTTVEEAVRRWRSSDVPDVLAVGDGSGIVGVVTVDDVRTVPGDERGRVTVESVMTPADDIPSVPADASGDDLLDALMQKQLAVVEDGGRGVGVVTAERVAEAVQRHQRLERTAGRR